MSAARDEVLHRIQSALRDVPVDERPEDVPVTSEYRHAGADTRKELVERFTDRLVDYKAKVSHVTEAELPAAIAAAWVVGARNVLRAALLALLEPLGQLRELEVAGDYTARLALLEELKGLPWTAVWDQFCLKQDVPVGIQFLDEIKVYEAQELSKRAWQGDKVTG
jgi:hypothetical protein